VLEKYFIKIAAIRNKPIERTKTDYENAENKVIGWYLIEKADSAFLQFIPVCR
jgi:hypothetical protein